MNVLDLASNTWKDIELPPSTSRRDHVSFLWNDYIYVYSGWRAGILTDYFRIDLLEEGEVEFLECYWDDMRELVFDYFSGSVCEPTREFIMFGGKLRGEITNRTFCLRMDKGSFYEPRIKGQKPAARQRHTSCSVRNKVYIFGGLRLLNHNDYNDLFVLTVSSGQYVWSQLVASTGLQVVEPRMTAVGDRLLICGGDRQAHTFRIYSVGEGRFLDVGVRDETAEIEVNQDLKRVYSHAIVANCEMAVVLGGYGIPLREYWTLRAEG